MRCCPGCAGHPADWTKLTNMPAPVITEPPDASPQTAPPIRRSEPSWGWRSAMYDFLVIVAGVLVALGAQSWWELRNERDREQDYLRQLFNDTQENERRLAVAISVDSIAGAAVTRLAAALFESGAQQYPADTLAAWFSGQAFSSSDYRPLSGSYGALMASGDLRLIRNDNLRALLVSYAARLEYEQDMLRLFLQQYAGEPDRIARALPFVRGLFFGAAQLKAADIDFRSLRQNRDAEAVFFAVQISNSNRLTHLRRLRDDTQKLRLALEEELHSR